jgi:hypothetical protein
MEGRITFEVVQHIGILSEGKDGWQKELNLLSWNGRIPKYDVRDWAPNRERAGKGIGLTKEEVLKLKTFLNAEFAE